MNEETNFSPEPSEAPSTESPTPPKAEKTPIYSYLFDVLEMFAWSLVGVFLIFTFTMRLCQVDGSSMENTLYENQSLLLYSVNYTPQQDDIIVFHLTKPEADLEKTLVKRVIATGGQNLTINFNTNEIFVDGVLYEDSHAVLKDFYDREIGFYTLTAGHHYDRKTGILSLTVPENHLFVLGDNRNFSKDSRNTDIMFVDERCVLGKVVLRLYPFTVFS